MESKNKHARKLEAIYKYLLRFNYQHEENALKNHLKRQKIIKTSGNILLMKIDAGIKHYSTG